MKGTSYSLCLFLYNYWNSYILFNYFIIFTSIKSLKLANLSEIYRKKGLNKINLIMYNKIKFILIYIHDLLLIILTFI